MSPSAASVAPEERLEPIEPYFRSVVWSQHFLSVEEAVLGRFTTGTLPNQALARALFTTSLAASRDALVRDFWLADNNNNNSADFDAEFLVRAIEGGDDLDYVCRVLRDGTVARHERINTFERVSAIVRDPMGPTLREALTLTRTEMEQRHGTARIAKTLPTTNEEQQLRQLGKRALPHTFSL